MSIDAKRLYNAATSSRLEAVRVSTSVLSQMFLYLASRKVDIGELMGSLDFDPETIKSPDAYVSADTYLRIQEEAARRTNDPCFGLHMGEFAEPGSWSILGYLMMNCRTLTEAARKSERYSRIIGNMIEVRPAFSFGRVTFVYFTPPHAPAMSRHCYESAMASSVRMMRTMTGTDIRPLETAFAYPAPASASEYERFFRCPVRFGRKDNSLTFDMRLGKIPIRLPNPELLRYFEAYAQEILTRMRQGDECTHTVTRIVLNRLDDPALSLRRVAREMSVSVRTLQNRLEREGVVFSGLLRELREKLAEKYLEESYSVEQIAYMLGFSDSSAFRKAFKKWTGKTPREYRDNTLDPHTGRV